MRRADILKLLLLLSLWNCKPQQYTFGNLPQRQLVFGSGGGITGGSDSYILLENGQLFHTNSFTRESEELPSVGREKAGKFFSELTQLQLAKMDFNHPGNLYYFLESVDGDIVHRVTWGSNDYEAPASCKTLYKKLVATIK